MLLVGAVLGSKRGATSLALGILPFLIGDAIKMVLAALALPAAWKPAQ